MWKVGPSAVFAIMTARIQFDLEGMLLAITLVGLILLGVLVILWLKRWQAAQRSATSLTGIEDYRALMNKAFSMRRSLNAFGAIGEQRHCRFFSTPLGHHGPDLSSEL